MQPKEKDEKAIDVKIDILIANVDALQSSIKNLKTPQVPEIDYSIINNLTNRLAQATDAVSTCTAEIGRLTEQMQQPLKTEHRHTFDIRSSVAFVSLIILSIISISAIGVLIYERAESNHLRDNDLKYRHVKMKGEVTRQRISELEDLFEINRDNTKIKQLRKDVELYEKAIRDKFALDEQARLKQQEAERLNQEAENIKKK